MKKNLFSTMLALLTIVAMLVSVGCKNYDDDISDINKKLSSVEGTLSTVSGQVTTLQSTVSSLQSTVDALKAEVAKCAKPEDVAKMQSQIDALNAAIKTANEAIAANTKAIEQNGKDIKEGAAYAAATYATIDALAEANAAIAAVQSEVAEVKAAAAKVAEVIAEIQSQIEAIKAALENYYTKEQIDAKLAEIVAGTGVVSISTSDDIEAGFGQFNGVFTLDKKKATWNGPRAAEVATLEKGTWLSTFDEDYFVLQVNPVSADLTNATFSIQNADGVSAPVIFGTPYRYEDTKAASGTWIVPFVANPDSDTIKDFIAINEGEGWFKNCSVVVNESVRSDYRDNYFWCAVSDKDTPVGYLGLGDKEIFVSEMTGEYTIEPEFKYQIFDQYITGITSINTVTRESNKAQFVADSIQYGLKVQGATLVYNAEAVAAQMKKQSGNFVIGVTGSTLSLAGFVNTGCSAELIIKHDAKPDDPKPETKEYDAINDTPTPHTLIPVESGQPYQTISIANAMKAFGLDDKSSDAYKLFIAAGYGMNPVGDPYYVINDLGETQEVPNLLYYNGPTSNPSYDKETFQFNYDTKYGYDGTADGIRVEGHTVYATVTLTPTPASGNKYSNVVYVIKNIPVSFAEPKDWTVFTSWEDMNLTLYTSDPAIVDMDIDAKFVNKYNKNTRKLVDKVDAKENRIYTFVKSTTPGTCYDANYAPKGWKTSMFSVQADAVPQPAEKSKDVAYWQLTGGVDGTFASWCAGPKAFRVAKKATATYTITGFQTELCGRIVPVKDAVVNVTYKETAKPTIVFSPSISIDYKDINNTNNYWSAYNTISMSVAGCNGTFTLTASNGKKMYFDNTAEFESGIGYYKDGEIECWYTDSSLITYIEDNVLKVNLTKKAFELAKYAVIAPGSKFNFFMEIKRGLKYQDTGEYVITDPTDTKQHVKVSFDVEIK